MFDNLNKGNGAVTKMNESSQAANENIYTRFLLQGILYSQELTINSFNKSEAVNIFY